MEERKKIIIQELLDVLVENDLTYAEAKQILISLQNKLYASAKIK